MTETSDKVSNNFVAPVNKIVSKKDLEYFLHSSTCTEIIDFVTRLSESVKGKPNSADCVVSEATQRIVNILSQLDNFITETPPLPTRSRFGNKAFVTLFDKVEENITSLMHMILPDELKSATVEIAPYFLHCIGNKQRIDYGSGHELNFVMWLFCLEKLGILSSSDYTALVLKVFHKYLDVMRHIQKSYWLEPAGSHGVWGLDDYQFLPFLFGSSQLIDHKHIKPKSVTYKEVVEHFAKEYMYMGCIQFILDVKSGSFFEHSPLLFDISGAKSWQKVNDGMIKMFRAEVLSKLPIMSHFMFGSLIALDIEESEHKDDECCDDHHHEEKSADQPLYRVQSCCVQRIPSAIAAKDFKN